MARPSITVMTDSGPVRGEVVGMRGRRILFVAEAEFDPGFRTDCRIEHRGLVLTTGLHVVGRAPGRGEADLWRAVLDQEFDPDELSASLTSLSSWSAERMGMRSARPSETRAALERMAERMGEPLPSKDPLGISREVPSGLTPTEGRRRMREALRRAIRERRGDRARVAPPAGEAPPDPGPPPERHSEESPRDALDDDPTDVHAPADGPDPLCRVERTARPARVVVAWRSAASLARDYLAHLRGAGLFVPELDLGGRGTPLEVVLHLPSGRTLRCSGEVVAPMFTGTGVALHIGRDELESIRVEIPSSP